MKCGGASTGRSIAATVLALLWLAPVVSAQHISEWEQEARKALIDVDADPSERIAWLRGLAVDPADGDDCRIEQDFWQELEVGGHTLSLGLFRVERQVMVKPQCPLEQCPGLKKKAPELQRVLADVLSVLVRHGNEKVPFGLWLRAGIDLDNDTGWIEITSTKPTSPDESSRRQSLFRSCAINLSGIMVDGALQAAAPREDRMQYLSVRRRGSGSGAPSLDGSATSDPIAVLVDSRSGLRPLGRTGVSQWLIENLPGQRSVSELARPELPPSASQEFWTQISTIAGRGGSGREIRQLTDTWAPEGRGNPEAGPPDQGLDRALTTVPVETSPESLSGRLGGGTPQSPDAEDSASPCESLPKKPPCLFAASAAASSHGFNWRWRGLANVDVGFGSLFTDPDGRLPDFPPSSYWITLSNRHLAIRSIQAPNRTIRAQVSQPAPHVLVQPGSELYETLVAGNIFLRSQEGLAKLAKLHPWIPDRFTNVEIHQTVHDGSRPCNGRRQPGAIYLPLGCPTLDGFVPKGLCRDLVLHELSHEVLGSLVGLATAQRRRVVGGAGSALDEGLSDLFAFWLRGQESQGVWRFGYRCQDDDRFFDPGIKNMARDGIVVALRTPTLGDKPPIPPKLLGQLVALAVLHGWRDVESFLDTLLDLAADKIPIEETRLDALCDSIWAHTGHCNSGICERRNRCHRIVGPRIEHDGIETHFPPAQVVTLRSEEGLDLLIVGALGGEVSTLRHPSAESPSWTEEPLDSERPWPGFTMHGGRLEGWSAEGEQLSVAVEAGNQVWQTPSRGDAMPPSVARDYGFREPRVSPFPGPRLEVLEIDGSGALLADWAGDRPSVRHSSWAEPARPDSLEVGLSQQALVLSVMGRYSLERTEYLVTREGLVPLPREDTTWTAYAREQPAVSIYRRGQEVERIVFDGSLCKAPPFLEPADGGLLAMTCDGHVAFLDPAADGETVRWRQRLDGVVIPEPGIDPIHRAELDGDRQHGAEWVLGPFRKLVDGRLVDSVVGLGLVENHPRVLGCVEPGRAMRGAPAVFDWRPDGQDRDTLAIVTDQVELWDRLGGCAKSDQASGGPGPTADGSRGIGL